MQDWLQLLPALVVAMARPLGVLLLLPVLSTRVLGGSLVRNALILMIALPVLPMLMSSPVLQQASQSIGSLALLVAREMLIGIVIGFFAALPFWAIGMSGFMLDTVRGTAMASVLNPMLGEQASIFGILFSHVLTVAFLITGGFNILLAALYDTYRTLPPALSFGMTSELAALILRGWRAMWDLCLSFAMPAIAGMLLVDVALALVNRSAQQLNVFFVAMPIKSAVALFLLAVSLPYGLPGYLQMFQSFGQTATSLVGTLR